MSEPLAGEAAADREPGRWGPWASLGWTIVLLGVYFVAQGAAIAFVAAGYALVGGTEAMRSLPSKTGLLVAASLLASAPFVAVATFLLAGVPGRRRGQLRLAGAARRALGLVAPRPADFLRWGAATAVLVFAYDLLGRLLGRPPVPEVMMDAYRTAGSLPLFCLALVGAAPLVEELLFRGFLLPGLAASRLGPAGAVALTALFWAGIHLQYDLFDISEIVVLGVVFGWARWRTGSTWLTLILHALLNAVALAEMGWLAGG